MIVNLAVPITLESSASSSSGYTWIKASVMNIICSNWRVCFKNCDLLVDVKGPKLPSPSSHSFRNKLETLQFDLCCPEVHFKIYDMILFSPYHCYWPNFCEPVHFWVHRWLLASEERMI